MVAASATAVPLHTSYARGDYENALVARDFVVARDLLQAVHARELAALDSRALSELNTPVKRNPFDFLRGKKKTKNPVSDPLALGAPTQTYTPGTSMGRVYGATGQPSRVPEQEQLASAPPGYRPREAQTGLGAPPRVEEARPETAVRRPPLPPPPPYGAQGSDGGRLDPETLRTSPPVQLQGRPGSAPGPRGPGASA
ncbi:hypothetical protein EIP91_005979 [Steccherinum ochraceum]|uniref:Uncharacterized protein n=1 Tax=Steccherinum ochraceum TaxID=92696 RepID=A0A4V2MVR8_9APHY|nr:hypothetical protein EIP91_005979 [Steccherinum ochraceum]